MKFCYFICIECSYSNSSDHNETTEEEKKTTTTSEIINLIREDLYKFVFMPMNKQFTNLIRCSIKRHVFDIYQTFQLEIEYQNDGKSVHFDIYQKFH